MQERIKDLLTQGEGLKIEFKKAQKGMPKSVYETVCAFSNTQGGDILLGIDDNGTILGIDTTKIDQYKKDFVNTINDSGKNCPPLYLSIETIEIDNKLILHINVPQSSEVQRCDGKIYIRNEDGDFDITHQQNNVANLYINKQNTYSESKIYKNVTIDDLRSDLIAKARKLAVLRQPGHPWAQLDDFELLKSSGIYKKDYLSGEEGITLAGILLLGKDEVIRSVLPHFKTDLIIRVKDSSRYDDRDDVRTNLIESYDHIMNFVNKHLPSPFYLEGTARIDIRNVIFREIAANILVHREYSSHFPARFVIEKDRIFTENGNKPYIHGNINPESSIPYPKNPTIAKFFKEIGLAEELGSGVRNLVKYSQIYGGSVPSLTDSEIFKLDWKINLFDEETIKNSDQASDQASDQVSDQASNQVSDQTAKILAFCLSPHSLIEILAQTKYTSRVHFRNKILKPLIDKGLLRLTVPDKPNSPNQKYETVHK